MNHHAHTIGSLERRIRDAEKDLFTAVGTDVEEFFLELAQTGLRLRVLSHGRGPAAPAPRCVGERRHLGAVVCRDRSIPAPRRGPPWSRLVRPGRLPARAGAPARRMIDDLLDAFGLDEVPALLMVDHLGVKQPLGPVERS